MNLLYLHGLYSYPMPEKMDLLEQKAQNIFGPKLDYFTHPDLFGWLLEEMELRKIDYIVGSSAGGLMGYWLARQTGCNALLFNPALAKLDMRADILQHTQGEEAGKPYFIEVILGGKDDTIPPQTTIDFLAMNDKPEHYHIHFLPELEHKIDLKTFEWGVSLIKI